MFQFFFAEGPDPNEALDNLLREFFGHPGGVPLWVVPARFRLSCGCVGDDGCWTTPRAS